METKPKAKRKKQSTKNQKVIHIYIDGVEEICLALSRILERVTKIEDIHQEVHYLLERDKEFQRSQVYTDRYTRTKREQPVNDDSPPASVDLEPYRINRALGPGASSLGDEPPEP